MNAFTAENEEKGQIFITDKFIRFNLAVSVSFVIPANRFVLSANELSVVHSAVNAFTYLSHLPVQGIPLSQHICIGELHCDLWSVAVSVWVNLNVHLIALLGLRIFAGLSAFFGLQKYSLHCRLMESLEHVTTLAVDLSIFLPSTCVCASVCDLRLFLVCRLVVLTGRQHCRFQTTLTPLWIHWESIDGSFTLLFSACIAGGFFSASISRLALLFVSFHYIFPRTHICINVWVLLCKSPSTFLRIKTFAI